MPKNAAPRGLVSKRDMRTGHEEVEGPKIVRGKYQPNLKLSTGQHSILVDVDELAANASSKKNPRKHLLDHAESFIRRAEQMPSFSTGKGVSSTLTEAYMNADKYFLAAQCCSKEQLDGEIIELRAQLHVAAFKRNVILPASDYNVATPLYLLTKAYLLYPENEVYRENLKLIPEVLNAIITYERVKDKCRHGYANEIALIEDEAVVTALDAMFFQINERLCIEVRVARESWVKEFKKKKEIEQNRHAGVKSIVKILADFDNPIEVAAQRRRLQEKLVRVNVQKILDEYGLDDEFRQSFQEYASDCPAHHQEIFKDVSLPVKSPEAEKPIDDKAGAATQANQRKKVRKRIRDKLPGWVKEKNAELIDALRERCEELKISDEFEEKLAELKPSLSACSARCT